MNCIMAAAIDKMYLQPYIPKRILFKNLYHTSDSGLKSCFKSLNIYKLRTSRYVPILVILQYRYSVTIDSRMLSYW